MNGKINRVKNRVKNGLKAALVCAVIPIMLTACWEDLEEISGKAEGGGTSAKVYAIGDTGPAGGIVFYVDTAKRIGYEFAPAEGADPEIAWSNVLTILGYTDSNNNWSALGMGLANTNAIVAQSGHLSSAAKRCLDYTVTKNGVTYDDWFLPSKDELQKIWWNLVSDQSADNSGRGKPHAGSLGGFANGLYWSSSEDDFEGAKSQSFGNGWQDNDQKEDPFRVRAVRAFSSNTIYNLKDIGPAGGWIFYANSGLYMEAAPADIIDGATQIFAWSSVTTTILPAVPQPIGIGSGVINTIAIISQGSHTASAAKHCADKSVTSNGTVYTDWFLPSRDELNAIWVNVVREPDGAGWKNSGVGSLADNYYWSSSEDTENYARSQDFYNGTQDYSLKNDTIRVRAVRAFNY
jgi:hypothetical protein